jgi:hypothetical protein
MSQLSKGNNNASSLHGPNLTGTETGLTDKRQAEHAQERTGQTVNKWAKLLEFRNGSFTEPLFSFGRFTHAIFQLEVCNS